MSLRVVSAGPGLSVQDLGRPGHLAIGLGRGGAMDRLALAEGAALLGQAPGLAALEMAGMGGVFEAQADIRIALTGAPMRARLNGQLLLWSASHQVPAGAQLEIGPVTAGSYGYLHLGGGIDARQRMGGRSAHIAAALGGLVVAGDVLEAGSSPGGPVGRVLTPKPRFAGGVIRLLPTAQSDDFGAELCGRLAKTAFKRDPRSNRQAVRLAFEGSGFALEGGLTVLSEITQPGDVQITGDGVPVILMAEAQTAGGYPRIATVLPADLPWVAQAPAGAPLSFRWITIDEALLAERAPVSLHARPLVRDPNEIADLLSLQLIGGAVTGTEEEDGK